LCIIGVLLLLDAMGLCNVSNWRGVNRE